MIAYNHKKGQQIRTDVTGEAADRAFLAHYQVSADDATVVNTTYIANPLPLAAAAQLLDEDWAIPSVPRCLNITGNVSGITGNVILTGTNWKGEVINDTIALNGVSTVNGVKAFKTLDHIHLPVRVHTPAYQTETKEVTHECTSSGHVNLTLTAVALGADSPKSLDVALVDTLNDVTKVADALVAALNADEKIGAKFTADHVAGVITLTAKDYAANDATLSLAFTDTDTTGVLMGGSTNGDAGVAVDIISVGTSEILGLPYLLTHNTVLKAYLDNALEAVAPTVNVSPTAIESNTIKLATALDSHVVDIYLMV